MSVQYVDDELRNRNLLWHYSHWETCERILTEQTLLASNLQYVNDASELLFTYGLFASQLEYPALRQIFDHAVSSRHLAGNAPYIASFSKRVDSISQWRGYSSGGIAVALGFDREALEAVAAPLGFSFCECDYPDQREYMQMLREFAGRLQRAVAADVEKLEQTGPPEVALRSSAGQALHERITRKVEHFLDTELLPLAVRHKHHEFRDEAEVRLVQTSPPADAAHYTVFRPKATLLAPYFRIDLAAGTCFPVKALVVGPNPHLELTCRAAELFRQCRAQTVGSARHGGCDDAEKQACLKAGYEDMRIYATSSPFRNW